MTTALSTYVKTQFYILDSENLPRNVSAKEYNEWHDSLPDHTKTTLGVRVASDFDDKTIISTVFLGEAHGYENDYNIPVLWETYLYCNGRTEMYRYSSHEDAMLGHDALCISFLEGY